VPVACPIEWWQPVNRGRLLRAKHSDDQQRAMSEPGVNDLCKQVIRPARYSSKVQQRPL